VRGEAKRRLPPLGVVMAAVLFATTTTTTLKSSTERAPRERAHGSRTDELLGVY
jgi:hypothetical protein